VQPLFSDRQHSEINDRERERKREREYLFAKNTNTMLSYNTRQCRRATKKAVQTVNRFDSLEDNREDCSFVRTTIIVSYICMHIMGVLAILGLARVLCFCKG